MVGDVRQGMAACGERLLVFHSGTPPHVIWANFLKLLAAGRRGFYNFCVGFTGRKVFAMTSHLPDCITARMFNVHV